MSKVREKKRKNSESRVSELWICILKLKDSKIYFKTNGTK